MSLPKQLVECFEKIKLIDLENNITQANIKEFVQLLNQSIPSAMNPVAHAIYRFNRTKYIADKSRFVSEIKDFHPYSAMILWTDFKDILSFFGLEQKIFLGWDKNNSRYRGYVLQTPSKDKAPTVDYSNDMDDDVDRIYNYMQQRIAACKQQD